MSDDGKQRTLIERLRAKIVKYDWIIADAADWDGRHPDDTPLSPDELPAVCARRDRACRQLRAVEDGA